MVNLEAGSRVQSFSKHMKSIQGYGPQCELDSSVQHAAHLAIQVREPNRDVPLQVHVCKEHLPQLLEK